MKCLGCYNEVARSYCPVCSKQLFGNGRMASVLDFDAPDQHNMPLYMQHSRRMSFSGVQLKYSLIQQGGSLVLSEDNSQFILKPIPPSTQFLNIECAPENEHLTMQIAKQVFKINTAVNALILFRNQKPAYLTRRFDLMADGKKCLQEDFAQLSNRSRLSHGEAYKYAGTYEEVGLLIKKSYN